MTPGIDPFLVTGSQQRTRMAQFEEQNALLREQIAELQGVDRGALALLALSLREHAHASKSLAGSIERIIGQVPPAAF